MATKKKAKELQSELMDSAHKVWLAGLGALAMAEEEGGKLFNSLVERGEGLEKKGREHVDRAKGTVSGMKTVAESYWDTFERTLDDKVTAVIHRLGVPTKDEIETLSDKVDDLTKAVSKLRAADKPKTTTRATKSTATRSAATKPAAK